MTTDDQSEENGQEPGRLREMYEQTAQELAESRRQLQALTTQGLFRDAGLNPGNKLHAAAIRGYDGEISAEAVTAYVSDLGITEAQAPPPQQAAPQAPPVTYDDQAALERIAYASMGGNQPPPAQQSEADAAWAKIQGLPRHAPLDQVNAAFDEWARLRGPVSRVTGNEIVPPNQFVTQPDGHPFR